LIGRFTGRSVLVAGAGGGIGRATVTAFAAEGADVTCADLDPAAAASVATRVAADGAESRAVTVDVTEPESCASAVAAAVDATGRLDVLVNVAGIGQFAPTADVTLEQWERTIAVNLTGTFLMCQAALPALLVSGGTIVNVASVAGVRAVPYNAAYCASKGGVVMLTKSLAVEFGARGVRVNCVCPSSVATSFLDNFEFSDAIDRSLFERGRSVITGVMEPATVATAITYLASDDAHMVTGAAFMMDGGATA
jgi:meso-butanediol dehydrogenase/(S,S)-butanediol dehydrogenase/diacetyl reductase